MKKKIIFGLAPLLVLALASCVMYNGKGNPKKDKSSSTEQPVSSESTPEPISSSSSHDGGSQGGDSSSSSKGGEVIPAKEVKVYLVFGEYGVYNGTKVDSGIPSLFLDHAIELTLKVGDELPTAPVVSSIVSGSTFAGWQSYDNGVLTTYRTVPDEENKILYASFSGGSGTNPGGGSQGGDNPGGGGGQGGDTPVEDTTTYLCSSGTDIAFSGYGFKFSDNTYMSGTHVGIDNGYDQYLISNRGFKKDQVFQLIDFSNGATWADPIDGWSFGGQGDDTWKSFIEFNSEANTYKVLKSFNASSIYIKLNIEGNNIYFALGSNQSEDKQVPGEPGQQGGGEQGGQGGEQGDNMPSTGFGLKFSDKNFVIAESVGEEQGYAQYKIESLEFKKYQEFTLIDFASKATWVVPFDGWSFGGESAEDVKWQAYVDYDPVAQKYTVLKDFNSNGIFLKLKENADILYIGVEAEQGGGGQGEEPGPQEPLPTDKGFGFKFSDGTYAVAEQTEAVDDFDQYKFENIEFKKDQSFSLIDFASVTTWAVPVDPWSFAGTGDETWKEYLELNENSYKVLKDFTAERIYLKLKFGEDNLYFALKDQGGEGQEDNLPAEGFGFIFGDNSYYVAEYVGRDNDFEQYKLENKEFKKGQVIQIADFGEKAFWAVDVDPYSFGGTSAESENWKAYLSYNALEETYTVLKDFTAESIYIKFKFQEDQLYFALAEGQGGEEGEEIPAGAAPFYLVGETTNWGYTNELALVVRDDDKPYGALHQWYLQTTVPAGKEFKLRAGSDSNRWLGIYSVEAGDSRDLVEGNDNFSFKEAGTYEIFLKQTSEDEYSIFIRKVTE